MKIISFFLIVFISILVTVGLTNTNMRTIDLTPKMLTTMFVFSIIAPVIVRRIVRIKFKWLKKLLFYLSLILIGFSLGFALNSFLNKINYSLSLFYLSGAILFFLLATLNNKSTFNLKEFF